MPWTEWVIDASMGCKDGMFCFCPIEGDLDGEFAVVTGINMLSATCPKDRDVVAVVHPDGQAAAESFCDQYEQELKTIFSLRP